MGLIDKLKKKVAGDAPASGKGAQGGKSGKSTKSGKSAKGGGRSAKGRGEGGSSKSSKSGKSQKAGARRRRRRGSRGGQGRSSKATAERTTQDTGATENGDKSSKSSKSQKSSKSAKSGKTRRRRRRRSSKSGTGGGQGSGQRGSGNGGGGGDSQRSRQGGGGNRSRRRRRPRRGSASSGSRRRVIDANDRPAEPVRKQIIISASDPNEIRVAVREEGRVVEAYVERVGQKSLAGNIYKGRVQNVLPGMEAAFVDVGLERNGFLYVDEVTPAAADSDQVMPVTVATGGSGDTDASSDADAEDVDSSDATAAADDDGSAQADASEDGSDADKTADTDDEAPGADKKSESGSGRGRASSRRKPEKRKIQDLLQSGQEILVQVVKDPMGTKGSRLTTQYSLAGRYLVYVPDGEGLGVSRRLPDEERERLRNIAKDMELPGGGGLIVRTAAEGAPEDDIHRDLNLLLKLHEKLMEQAGQQKAPRLLYSEADLSLRIIRDLFNDEVEAVVVDDQKHYERITSYLKRTSPSLVERVEHYTDELPIFERYGVEEAIESTLDKRVDLPSGGYLIIDYAEAFTVIDINTGRNVGKSSLEETITKTNMEAAEEIARQLRLRDIGGIIVIDFIDMNMMKNRDAVLEHYRKELCKDRTKTYLVDISPLGLVEMTRQNVSDGVREILTETCATCGGTGVQTSTRTRSIEVEQALRDLVEGLDEKVEAIAIDVEPGIHHQFAGSATKLEDLGDRVGTTLRVFPDADMPRNTFRLRAKGTRDEIESLPEPLRRGQKMTVRIEEVHPLNAEDGVAYVDGYAITVVGAADIVGNDRRIVIEGSRGNQAIASKVRTSRRRRRRKRKDVTADEQAAAVATAQATATEADADDSEEFDIDDEVTIADSRQRPRADETDADDPSSEIPERDFVIEGDSDDDSDDDEDESHDDVTDDDLDDDDVDGDSDDGEEE